MKTNGNIDFLHSVRKREGGILKMVKELINPPPIETEVIEEIGVEELINKTESVLDQVESMTKPLEEKINQLDSEKAQLKMPKSGRKFN